MFLGNLIVAGLTNGSLYCLVALGLVLIYRVQNIANFGHGELFMAGAFIGFSLLAHGLPYGLTIPAAIVLGSILGVLVQLLSIRPLAAQSHVAIVMSTVGISVAFKGVARFYFGGDIHTFPPIFTGSPYAVGPVLISPQSIVVVLTAVALTTILFLVLRSTRMGREMTATQQNPIGASVVGINVKLIHTVTWGVAAGIAAASGVLAAPATLLYPDVGSLFLIKGFAAAVLGGFGSPMGAILGGMTIGVGEMLIGGYLGTSYIEISPYLIIIGIMLLKPEGLFGRSFRARV